MTNRDKRRDYTLRPATPADDASIRALLRNNPMPGDLSLTFEREPNYFHGAAVEGDVHQSVLAFKKEKTVGIGSRSTRRAYVDGTVQKLGYLSQLRIDASARGKHIAPGGYLQIAKWHKEDDCPFYVTTVISDNHNARKILEAEWEPKPAYKPYSRLTTLLLSLKRTRRYQANGRMTVRQATARDLPEIANCLQRNYAKYQFAPYWTVEALDDPHVTRGLDPGDFTIAVKDDEIVGCLAVWDQQSFKQTVVQGYGGRWRYLRKPYNLAAPIIGTPSLPPAGSLVPHAYISHVAIDHDEIDIYRALLTEACGRAVKKNYLYLAIGWCEGNPLLAETKKRFRHIEYESIIYLAYYKENEDAAGKLESRIPHLELAVL